MSDDAGALQPELAVPPPPSSSPQMPDESSGLRKIFVGPNGIRAGWRLIIFLMIVAVLNVCLGLALRLLHVNRAANEATLEPFQLFVLEGTIFLFACIATAIMARIEHRKLGEYGLPFRSGMGKHFWEGTVWGFLAISGTLLTIFALHGFHITGLAIHGAVILGAVASWSITFLMVGLSEEFAFRGYTQFTLTTGIGFWPSAVLFSALFAAAHLGNPGETKTGLLSVVWFGLLFCLILRRTGNLWWAVGFHAGWDWGQTFFYGVHDSGMAPYHNLLNSEFFGPNWLTGGSVGPEASVFTPIALLVVAVLFSRRYPERKYQPLGSV
jgi:membrane protease YdiL (CAAX protease family)